ncbi:thermonuclease family protein [Ensifer sp. ENS04]|uniref:thermonuclease family protein n=1 Tax=Ensifer sp. ENS04 TaxID=2769281 RepID=UPI001784D1A9|nr:thermonuclease family protein [Ensifer sp. ENS04]MBD9541429.1 thermonuclease family protein [Ensifer sp. ENS04]
MKIRSDLLGAIAGFLVLTSLSNSEAAVLSGQARVVDGDTLEVAGVVVRLHGVDAPEAGQRCNLTKTTAWPCGEAAMDRLAELVSARITCQGTEHDAYGRLLAICQTSDGSVLNSLLVAQGYAWAFRKYSTDYVAEEETARAKKSGVWQAPTQAPWDYRAAKWAVAEKASPNGCPIKGNISSNGHIYHPPWSPWYAKTKVTLSKGERWFCSESEAIAAGWRAPSWR